MICVTCSVILESKNIALVCHDHTVSFQVRELGLWVDQVVFSWPGKLFMNPWQNLYLKPLLEKKVTWSVDLPLIPWITDEPRTLYWARCLLDERL